MFQVWMYILLYLTRLAHFKFPYTITRITMSYATVYCRPREELKIEQQFTLNQLQFEAFC